MPIETNPPVHILVIGHNTAILQSISASILSASISSTVEIYDLTEDNSAAESPQYTTSGQKLEEATDSLYRADWIVLLGPDIEPFFHINKSTIRRNVATTHWLVNELLSIKTKKLVYVSHVLALGIKHPDMMVNEKQIFGHSEWDTPYGLLHFLCEQEVWRASAEGLDIMVLNTGMLYEVHDNIYRPLRYIDSQLCAEKALRWKAWVDIAQLGRAIAKIINMPKAYERIILTDLINTTLIMPHSIENISSFWVKCLAHTHGYTNKILRIIYNLFPTTKNKLSCQMSKILTKEVVYDNNLALQLHLLSQEKNQLS